MSCVRVEEGRGGRCGLYERGGDVGVGGRKKGKGKMWVVGGGRREMWAWEAGRRERGEM